MNIGVAARMPKWTPNQKPFIVSTFTIRNVARIFDATNDVMRGKLHAAPIVQLGTENLTGFSNRNAEWAEFPTLDDLVELDWQVV